MEARDRTKFGEQAQVKAMTPEAGEEQERINKEYREKMKDQEQKDELERRARYATPKEKN